MVIFTSYVVSVLLQAYQSP